MEPSSFFGRGARRKTVSHRNPIVPMQSEEDSESLSEFEATIGSDCNDSQTDSSNYAETSSDENKEISQDEMDQYESSNLQSDLGNLDLGIVWMSERQYVYNTDEETLLRSLVLNIVARCLKIVSVSQIL